MTDEGWMPPVPPARAPTERPEPRATDGEVLTITIRKKVVYKVFAPLVTLLFGASGTALWKSFDVEDTAETAIAQTDTVAKQTDLEAGKSYEALRKRAEEGVAQDAAQAKATNEVITRLALLERLVLQESSVRGAAAYRAKKKPALPAAVPAPKPAPLPATPEAAAAAASPATPALAPTPAAK
jgi:hypothetical protein